MPTPSFIQPPADTGLGKKVDSVSFGGSPETIRQVAAIGDGDVQAAVVKVTNAPPISTDYGLTTRRAPKGITLAAFNFNASGDLDLIAAAGVGKVNKVWKLWLMVDGDTALTIKDGATANIGPLNLAQGGLIEWQYDEELWFITSANQVFRINSSAVVRIAGIVGYTQE